MSAFVKAFGATLLLKCHTVANTFIVINFISTWPFLYGQWNVQYRLVGYLSIEFKIDYHDQNMEK